MGCMLINAVGIGFSHDGGEIAVAYRSVRRCLSEKSEILFGVVADTEIIVASGTQPAVTFVPVIFNPSSRVRMIWIRVAAALVVVQMICTVRRTCAVAIQESLLPPIASRQPS